MAQLGPALRWPDATGFRGTDLLLSVRSHLPAPLNEVSPEVLLALLTSLSFILFLAVASSTALRRTPGSTRAIPAEASSASYKKLKARETPKVILLGPSNVGKTSIFSALAFASVPSLHPSQRESESVIAITATPVNELKEVSKRNIHLFDTPGHPRIKDRIIEETIKDADVLIFCVDAKESLRGSASVGQAKDSSVVEAVDHLHAALTQLVKGRKSEKRRPPTLLVLFTRSDLSPHLNNVSLSSASEDDVKRRSILLSRAQTTLESELSKRRAGMGLRAKKSAKVGGMGKVQGGGKGEGVWATIKSLLGLRSIAKGGQEEEDEEDEDDASADYVVETASTQADGAAVSLSKLNPAIIHDGKAVFAFAAVGKERGWAEREFEGLHELKQILLHV